MCAIYKAVCPHQVGGNGVLLLKSGSEKVKPTPIYFLFLLFIRQIQQNVHYCCNEGFLRKLRCNIDLFYSERHPCMIYCEKKNLKLKTGW